MSHKGRHCNKFYTSDGCPYGDSCKFLHDDKSKEERESVVISLGPTEGRQSGGGSVGSVVAGSSLGNWKTRICNKWEMMRYCPYGNKCRFAHGSHELPEYTRGHVEPEGRAVVAAPSRPSTENAIVGSTSTVPQSDGNLIGVPLQRLPVPFPRLKQRHMRRDCNLVSRIYADWIDDIE
ncbi:zinc finger CCCH domain-containing protein 56-like [Impatiens glandulifera]|uniref:zinc finger CCCH domain-containing protein 56-like n=1 Tax=Impatiens glandulifera TaxID=253017 RepID=UPI001FB04DEF|nr:zinc finger CCCH domain-containing protein 56-like [Impatiens glandulifera]